MSIVSARGGGITPHNTETFQPNKGGMVTRAAYRAGQHFTALFSNTARAHTLGVTRDCVVIYRDEREGDGQWTTITSHYGPLRGRRIIRGREQECRGYYLPPGSMLESHP